MRRDMREAERPMRPYADGSMDGWIEGSRAPENLPTHTRIGTSGTGAEGEGERAGTRACGPACAAARRDGRPCQRVRMLGQ